jgi:hypothetical protein
MISQEAALWDAGKQISVPLPYHNLCPIGTLVTAGHQEVARR